MSDATRLTEYLRRFNRKERFILLDEVCGRGTFRIDSCFARRLGEHLDVTIPCDAFVAMDYHLDWIQMALHLDSGEAQWESGHLCNSSNTSGRELFEANQQDIDLLIVFRSDKKTHIILIEAKADTPWDWMQLKRKAKRLKQIFGDKGGVYDLVCPQFILMSQESKKPKNWREYSEEWPAWMRGDDGPHWMELRLDHCLKVNRCGTDAKGRRWLYLREWVDGNWRSWLPS